MGDEQDSTGVPAGYGNTSMETTSETQISNSKWSRQLIHDVDFTSESMWNQDFSGSVFSRCVLSGVNFQGLNLGWADFRDSDLQETTFSGLDVRMYTVLQSKSDYIKW